ncbi:MAG: MATE family efflux transporter [Pirellulales bacterium]
MSVVVTQSRGTLRPLARLVWPVLAEQLLVMLVGFSDTLLAGHYLGPQHLAAMTMISYVLWLFTNLFSFVAIGAVAMTARFVGAQDWLQANRVVNQSYVLGAILAAAFTTVGLLAGNHLAGALQLHGESETLATRYLYYLIAVMPLMMCESVGIGCLRGAGDMVTGLFSMIMVNTVNIALSWSLLLGVGPLPEMGWDGLAIGTSCGHFVGGMIPLVVLLRGRSGLRIERRLLRPDPNLMRRILRIGVPGGVDTLSITSCQLVFLSMIDRLGTVAAAAHGVAIRVESLAYLPGYAFQLAAATLAGQYLGARDYRQARRSVLTACAVSGTMLCGVALLFYLQAPLLVDWFLGPDQDDVAAVAPQLLRIIAIALPALGLMQVLTGALRGAGDTRWPLAFTFVGFLVVRLPLAWALTQYWSFGVQGAWLAMAADVIVRCLLIVARFLTGGWRRVEV